MIEKNKFIDEITSLLLFHSVDESRRILEKYVTNSIIQGYKLEYVGPETKIIFTFPDASTTSLMIKGVIL
jgi:hypothetical protein